MGWPGGQVCDQGLGDSGASAVGFGVQVTLLQDEPSSRQGGCLHFALSFGGVYLLWVLFHSKAPYSFFFFTARCAGSQISFRSLFSGGPRPSKPQHLLM